MDKTIWSEREEKSMRVGKMDQEALRSTMMKASIWPQRLLQSKAAWDCM